MKETITNASVSPANDPVPTLNTSFPVDFPKTADGRVYHLGLRSGEVANRIVGALFFFLSLLVNVLTNIGYGDHRRGSGASTNNCKVP